MRFDSRRGRSPRPPLRVSMAAVALLLMVGVPGLSGQLGAQTVRDAPAREASAELRYRLGVDYAAEGRPEAAVAELEAALGANLATDLRGRAWLALAVTLVQLGRADEAADAFNEVLKGAPSRATARQVLESLAFLESERGNHQAAANLFLRAAELLPASRARLLDQAAEALVLAESWQRALEVGEELLAIATPGEEWVAAGLERQAWLLSRLGRTEEAVTAFRAAVAAGRDHPRLHQGLGLDLYRLGRWEEARQAFLSAATMEPSASSHLYLGRTLIALGRPGLAVHYLELALAEEEQLAAEDRVSLLDTLGFQYYAQYRWETAAEVWSRSLAERRVPATQVRLGAALRRAGRFEEAGETLAAVAEEELTTDLAAMRLDELAAIEVELGHLEAAAATQARALALEPSAERHFRLGLRLQELGRHEAAVAELRQAVAATPESLSYRETLGYALVQIGRREEAIAELTAVVAQDPDYLRLFEDLGYLHQREHNNPEAESWFRSAIDNAPLYPVATRKEEIELAARIYRLRGEVSKLSRRLEFTLYGVLRSEVLPDGSAPGAVAGGVLPSQGGLEVAWTPPRLGFRSDRVLQLFGRMLMNLEPNSVQPIDESYQGSLGIRYKPLRRHVLVLSAERLFAIGEASQDNWLLRGQYSLAAGSSLRPDRRAWNSSSLYLDVGWFAEDPVTWAYYAELRQGVALRLGRRTALTPHLVVDGRWQDPTPRGSAYLQWGGGASVRWVLGGDAYRAPTSWLELTVQYKWGELLDLDRRGLGESFEGWVLTVATRI